MHILSPVAFSVHLHVVQYAILNKYCNDINCLFQNIIIIILIIILYQPSDGSGPHTDKTSNVGVGKYKYLITHMMFIIQWGMICVCLMVFNATFNNISAISWRPVLLVEETGELGENHRPVASHWQLYHIMLYTSPWSRFELTTSVVIGTDCIDSCKSNYHTITATTALNEVWMRIVVLLVQF